jgi:TPR repeat protein
MAVLAARWNQAAAELARVGIGLRVQRTRAAGDAGRAEAITRPVVVKRRPEPAVSAEPRIVSLEPLTPRPRAASQPAAAVSDAPASEAAASPHRLWVAATISVGAIIVAIVAYYLGATIAVIVANSETRPRPAAERAVPAARAAPAPQPAAPSPPPVVTLPSDPAARAGFYLARAKAGDAAAQYDVAVLYARGEGLVQDFVSAASWFHAAAAQGSIPAEYNLGVLYERGLGVAPSSIEALNWYRSAADRDHAGAQYNLALAYAEGRGAEQDLAAAARWYQRAAQQGVMAAMVNLAILYERGSGLDRSLIDAYAWYSAAGEAGDAPAKQRAGEIYRQLSEHDKARADGLAATIGATIKAPPA